MFWESGLVGNDIYSLIGRDPPPSLEEVLLEEGIIQEVKSRDSRIIEYLILDVHLNALIDFVIIEDVDVTGDTSAYRFPFVSSEILSSGIAEIYLKLVESPLLRRLFSVFKRPSVNTIMCNFTAKILMSLLSCSPGRVYEYIFENQEELFKILFDHIEHSSVIDFLVKLLHPEMETYQKFFIDLLRTQKLVERIYDLINPATSQIKLARVSFMFFEIIRIARVKSMQIQEEKQWILRELVEDMQSNANLDNLILNMFTVQGYSQLARYEAISTGCSILLCLFDLSRVGDVNGDEFVEASNINLCFNLSIATDFKLIASYIPMFTNFLKEVMNAGEPNPEVMSVVLLIIRFLSACALHNVPYLNKTLTESGFFHLAIESFLKYPYFNLLHDVIIYLFNSILQGHFYCYVSTTDIEDCESDSENKNLNENEQKSGNDSILSENAFLQFYLIDDVKITQFLLGVIKNTDRSMVGYEGHVLNLMEHLSVFTSDVLCPVSQGSEICAEHGPNGDVLKDFGVESCDVCHRACWDTYMDTKVEDYKANNEVGSDLGGFDLNLYGDQLDVFYATQNMSNLSPAIVKQKIESVKKEVEKGLGAMDVAKTQLIIKVPPSFVQKNQSKRKSFTSSCDNGLKEEQIMNIASKASSKTKFLQNIGDRECSSDDEHDNSSQDNKIDESTYPNLTYTNSRNTITQEEKLNPFIIKELIKPLNSLFAGENNNYIYSVLKTKISNSGELYLGENFVAVQPKIKEDGEAEQLRVPKMAYTVEVGSAESDMGPPSCDTSEDIFKDSSSDCVFDCGTNVQFHSDDEIVFKDASVNMENTNAQNDPTGND